VGGWDEYGEVIDSVPERFLIVADISDDNTTVYLEELTEGQEFFDNDVPVYFVGSEGAFSEPLTVQVPIPDGVEIGDLEILYYHESSEPQGWYRGENVIGWMIDGSQKIVYVNNQPYLEFQVNHSGVFQLVEKERTNLADIGILALLLGVFCSYGLRRQR